MTNVCIVTCVTVFVILLALSAVDANLRFIAIRAKSGVSLSDCSTGSGKEHTFHLHFSSIHIYM